MNEPQPVQISLAEVAAAIGPEQLLLRLVVLQRRVAELEALLVAPVVDVDPDALPVLLETPNGR